ncbi:ABC transporter ATP-binding protein [Mycobacterium cookii]|uniref:ABC transporter ATP-binding protein n=1 Tax=Nocardioides furvisabuli TaxID=375542 RepID=A0ABP5J6Q4_9ACTN|nr:ATP-binding cassette domain-containing protein [Nocardioides furvisabuli]
MSGQVLVVDHLAVSVAGQQVVEDVSFTVPATGITAVLGRNGVGKTSTLKGVLGLYQRTGEVTLAGERIDALPTHKVVQRGIGYVPEDREVFARLTVSENLALAERQGSATRERREMVDRLFPDLVQRRDQMAGTLSGGQQQMVALARVLLNDNLLLLVDEPTKGLAPLIVEQVIEALRLASATVPILLVEQNLDVVRRLAGDAVVIAGGRVVHTGSASDLLSDELLTQRLLGVHAESGEVRP